MPKFCANLSWMYQEYPFLERFGRAHQDGFKAVECLFPYPHAIKEIQRELSSQDLKLVLINSPAGDWDKGERGLAIDPQHTQRFKESLIELAVPTALALECKQIHVMSGVLHHPNDWQLAQTTFEKNLEWALMIAQKHELTLLIEPISHQSIPHYFLRYQQQAQNLIEKFNSPYLKLQLDLYHCQMTEGRLTEHLVSAVQKMQLGHIQIAGVPHRHEPDEGEINYLYLFDLLDHHHYMGYVGCEYSPKNTTHNGLGWLKPYLDK